MSQFPQPICEQIWNDKYRLITPNENIKNDDMLEDTWARIAKACAGIHFEDDDYLDCYDQNIQDKVSTYYSALKDFGFLPAGRITAGAGSGRNVTLFNCYVMGTIPDSMGGIFDMLKEAALTMQQGGGIGYDFSTLRPKNSPVKGVDADASGPLTFMDVWDSMCRTVMSAGSRRGAMMATMRCDHPDIEDFITVKQDSTRLRMFNLSVLCTDQFMSAVENDGVWRLMHKKPPSVPVLGWEKPVSGPGIDGEQYIHKEVRAKDLWNLIMQSTYDAAEPGILFIDRINQMNNLWDQETISATNPCGEQPLPPYGACLLGSINLTQVVTDPFEEDCHINLNKLEFLVRQAVEMLDSVIDISNFPVEKQREEAQYKRRMGLGITGLADMLFMLNQTYGSEEAANMAEFIMRTITTIAYRKSIELAKLHGPCPAMETMDQRTNFIKSGFMKNMPDSIQDSILEHGIRNALLTSIAPTGTISLYAGNVSSGIEPMFATSYTRKVLNKDGTKREELVEDYAVKAHREWCQSKGYNPEDYYEHLVTAQTLTPQDHLVMQAAVQKWVDSSISKTINCPVDISFEDFKQVYLDAYRMGCKGCTTYRPNDITGSILAIEPEKKEKPVEVETTPVVETKTTLLLEARDRVLDGQTYKLKWQGTNFYVTINNRMMNDKLTPFEIFINTQDMSHFQWTVALTRMMSSVFRRNNDIQFVIQDLKSIMDPHGGAFVDGRYQPSFIALLGQTLESHVASLQKETNVEESQLDMLIGDYEDISTNAVFTSAPMQCPSCKGFNMNLSGGCPVCGDCGHSKCG